MLQSLLPLKQVNKLRDDQVEGIVQLLIRQHGREEARAIVVKNPSILLTKGEGGRGGDESEPSVDLRVMYMQALRFGSLL
jgi:hypothetical protein